MSETKRIDVRGLSCPQPVLCVQKELQNSEIKTLEVLVDTGTSRENIRRFATNMGCRVQIEEEGDQTVIKIER